MTAAAFVLLLLFLLLARVNLTLILLAAAAFVHVFWGQGTIEYLAQDMWDALNREIILAIPLFLLVGSIMNRGTTARRLVNVIVEIAKPFPAGLAVATILSCAAFSSVSGSSIVTMLAVGTVMYPALIENGYSKSFSIGALCAGGSLGVVIPPSIPMILYGITTESSITDLFIAGIGPGLLLTAAFAAYTIFVNRKLERRRLSVTKTAKLIRDGVFAWLMPVILLGGIYSGYFSPTEAAAVALLYAILIESVIYRELNLSDYAEIVVESGKLLGALLPLIAIAYSINLVIAQQGVASAMVDLIMRNVSESYLFLLTTNLVLLAVGCVMDPASAILLFSPLLVPVAEAYEISSTYLGIIIVLNLEIGLLTPPFGLNLIVAATTFGVRFGFVCRAAIPWILIMIACLLLVVFQPWLAMDLVE